MTSSAFAALDAVFRAAKAASWGIGIALAIGVVGLVVWWRQRRG